MKKASFVTDSYTNNRIFNIKDNIVNRDNFAYYAFHLKQEFLKYDIDLSTSDINDIESSDIVIYDNMPKRLPNQSDVSKSYLLLFEPAVVKPENFDTNKHKSFNKIFTWNDDLIDNTKYFKINFSHLFPKIVDFSKDKKERFCTLIAGNKNSTHELELYSHRIKAIQWFEKNQPDSFDFYGMGWDRPNFKGSNRLIKYPIINVLLKSFAPRFSSYKGSVESKKEILSKYKFCICYENARDIPGYITEKIFDCFFAGSVPIYWGANNITDYIPEDCFIDKRLFSSYMDLYKYISEMSDNTYNNYISNIVKFINSDDKYIFTTDYFVETICREVLK